MAGWASGRLLAAQVRSPCVFRYYALMAESAAPFMTSLQAIVGDFHVITSAADTAPYVTDWRERYQGQARAVVRPGSTAEVAAVARVCAEHGVPIVPQGGNTGLCGGATPHAGGDEIVMQLSRLNRVRDIDTENATMTVEAGVPLAALQHPAAEAGPFFPPSLAAGGARGVRGQALGDRLTGFELISADCVTLTRAQFRALPDPLPGHHWYVLLQADDASANSPLLAQVEAALADCLSDELARDAVIAQSEAQAVELWSLRERISEAQKREGPNMKHDISLPVSRIAAFLARAKEALDTAMPGVRYVIFGHLGDGNLHYNLSAPVGVPSLTFIEQTSRANRIVYDLVAELGGSFSAEHGVGQMKRTEMERYKAPIELELMRRMKRALDPH